jgi:hypothetical protein
MIIDPLKAFWKSGAKTRKTLIEFSSDFSVKWHNPNRLSASIFLIHVAIPIINSVIKSRKNALKFMENPEFFVFYVKYWSIKHKQRISH